MTVYYLRDRNPMWKQTMQRMIQRLSDLAIRCEDYCYYPAGSFEPNARLNPQAEIPIGSTWGISWNSRLIQGLAQYYKATGDDHALHLGQKANTIHAVSRSNLHAGRTLAHGP